MAAIDSSSLIDPETGDGVPVFSLLSQEFLVLLSLSLSGFLIC